VRVTNVHQRELRASAAAVGDLIDRLASDRDELWPHDRWPAMRFDRPLGVGASGGHGPIGYVVEEYVPGHFIRFRFSKPAGFLGTHRFEIEEYNAERVVLRHVIEMRAVWGAYWFWLFAIRPLHNALLEDALDSAELSVGAIPRKRNWSLWVRFLRWSMAGRRSVKRK